MLSQKQNTNPNKNKTPQKVLQWEILEFSPFLDLFLINVSFFLCVYAMFVQVHTEAR